MAGSFVTDLADEIGRVPAFSVFGRVTAVRGLLVECAGPFRVGMRAEISFRLPSHYSVAATARVVRRHGADRFGMEFLRIPKSAISEIHRFTGSHRQG